MRDESSFKKFRRLIGHDRRHSAKSKPQNESPTLSKLSLPTSSPQADTSLSSSENATPLTSAQTSVVPSTAIPEVTLQAEPLVVLNEGVANNALEIPETTTNNQTENIGKNLAKDCSFWEIAYDSLKKEDPSQIAAYEDLLSRALIHAQANKESSNTIKDTDEIINQIPQNDTISRREMLRQITELGLKHMETKKIHVTLLGHEIALQNIMSNIADVVKWTETYIQSAVSNFPYMSILLAGISLVLPLLKNPSTEEAANQDGFIYVTSQIRYYVAMEPLLLPEHMRADLRTDFTEHIVKFYKSIIDFQIQTILRFYCSRAKNLLKGAIKYDNWNKKLQNIKDAEKELILKFETAISATSLGVLRDLAKETESLQTAFKNLIEINRSQLNVSQETLGFAQKMDRRISDAENRACLRDLHATDPWHDKERIEQSKGGLLRDSYSWIFNHVDFQQWRDNEQSRLLWIRGDPGKGKTMLLCGIIDELIEPDNSFSNVAFFFCQATNVDLNNATAVLRGLVYMLAMQQPLLISHLRESYDIRGERHFTDINAFVALSKIFQDILEDPRIQNTCIIIDALDECITGLTSLIDLVQKSLKYSKVKWIVSSRNWPDIEKLLNRITPKSNLYLELNEDSISAAVSTYIQFKVDQLAAQNDYDDDTQDAVLKYLLSNANGTFLWVSLVCAQLSYISGWEAEDMLPVFPPGLDPFYGRMIDQICDSKRAELCKSILAVALVVYRPITWDELAIFVKVPPRSSGNHKIQAEIIGWCGSFLSFRRGTISFVHQSAKDFLVKRTSQKIFPSGIRRQHHTIFSQSLGVISRTLQYNIYNIKAPGSSIDEIEQPRPDPLATIQYFCLYWVDHLLYNGNDTNDTNNDTNHDTNDVLRDDGLVHNFLSEKCLYWFEALSLIKNLPKGIIMIKSLENKLKSRGSPNLKRFIYDMKRFLLFNRSVIENSPLQIYCSALVFIPEKSIIRTSRSAKHIPAWIQAGPKMQPNWNSGLQTLEGHTKEITSLTFSSDGDQIISGSYDKTIRIWDAETGTIQQTLNYSSAVNSIAFSSKSRQIISGSSDKMVQLWDTETGTIQQTFRGHLGRVNSVAFSPDNRRIISGSEDTTIRLWDIETGMVLQLFKGHDNSVNSVAFSHNDEQNDEKNGERIVSGSSDNTVRLWTEAGKLQQIYKGHEKEVTSVAFSPNDKQIASGSGDRTIRLWDTEKGTLQHVLKDHTSWISSLAFSPGGKQIAFGLHNRSVRFWNIQTGAVQQRPASHSRYVSSVAFSPDGKYVISGSYDNTIRFWDAEIGISPQVPQGHTHRVNSVAFSPSGKQIVSGSSDRTVRLWTETGELQQTLENNTREVMSVAFSSDGRQIACGSFNKIIQICAESGMTRQTLEGDMGYVSSVAFSPNSKQVASGSYDNTVRLWTETGMVQQMFKGHTKWISSIAFSSDGQKIVSGSYDYTIRIWDIKTGTSQQILRGHTSKVALVSFSSDNSQIISRSENGSIRLWDVDTGKVLPQERNIDNTLFTSDDWIIEGSSKLMWLPPEYRAVCEASSNNTIALGHVSGKISAFRFEERTKFM